MRTLEACDTRYPCDGDIRCAVHAEYVHLRPATTNATCAVHEWPTIGLARRLIEAMRKSHGKGGVNACVDCLDRARLDAAGAGGP